MFQVVTSQFLDDAVRNRSPTTNHATIVSALSIISAEFVEKIFVGYQITYWLITSFNHVWLRALALSESKYKTFFHFGLNTTKIQCPTWLFANKTILFFSIVFDCRCKIFYLIMFWRNYSRSRKPTSTTFVFYNDLSLWEKESVFEEKLMVKMNWSKSTLKYKIISEKKIIVPRNL